MVRIGVWTASVLAALATAAGAAAHGDPTSHYLETESFLTSYASPPAVPVELQLRGLLDAAAARGYPIKLSLIANEGDTGGDSPPLEDPQWYAEGVARELQLVRPLEAPILVVTPRVIGVAGNEQRDGRLRPLGRERARELVAGVAVAGKPDGTALARSAMLAIRRLAREAGRPLPANVPPARAELTGSALAAVAAQHRADDGWSTTTIVLLVLGTAILLGGLVFAVARSAGRAGAGAPGGEAV